jgi:hypothetical protein
VQEQLLFLIGPPRSGSTLLTRMLGSHADVFAPQEPHLLTPLAHLGYHERVAQAPYDPVITQTALRELVAALPRGEEDYLDALRACTDSLYRRLLAASGRRLLLDKTPAYALVLEFIAALYPDARYIVLTRNPLAVWTSYVNSFFDGDHAAAHSFNPILERYVPAIARFLRAGRVNLHHVQYEQLVADPASQLQRICEFTGIAYDEGMINYGAPGRAQAKTADGLGDPITVARETRPTTHSIERWTNDLAGDPAAVERARRILASLADEDLETWGYRRSDLAAQLDAINVDGRAPKRASLTRYTAQRKLLVRLRKNIHHNAFGRLVRRIRTVCDVLLR